MTINKYYFLHRNTNFVIYARDIPDAFEPYRRILMGKTSIESFENNLIDLPPIQDTDLLMLCGNSISRDEMNQLMGVNLRMKKTSKVYSPAPTPKTIVEAIKTSIPVSLEEVLGDEWKSLPTKDYPKSEQETDKFPTKFEGDLSKSTPIKRRGRPKGSKNKSKDIASYFN